MEHEGFWVLVSDPEIRIQGIVIAEGVWRWIRQVLQKRHSPVHLLAGHRFGIDCYRCILTSLDIANGTHYFVSKLL